MTSFSNADADKDIGFALLAIFICLLHQTPFAASPFVANGLSVRFELPWLTGSCHFWPHRSTDMHPAGIKVRTSCEMGDANSLYCGRQGHEEAEAYNCPRRMVVLYCGHPWPSLRSIRRYQKPCMQSLLLYQFHCLEKNPGHGETVKHLGTGKRWFFPARKSVHGPSQLADAFIQPVADTSERSK